MSNDSTPETKPSAEEVADKKDVADKKEALWDADLDQVSGGAGLSSATSNVVKNLGEALATAARKG